jgi:hypothetical protein
MTPDNNPNILTTTIGELAQTLYEEAFADFGDEKIARVVSSQLLNKILREKEGRAA